MKYTILFLLLLCGCNFKDDRHPSIIEQNKKELSSNGILIGTLKDGRKIYRYQLGMGDYLRNHYIYTVENSDTVSINHEEQDKAHSSHVEVIIDGTKYRKVEDAVEN